MWCKVGLANAGIAGDHGDDKQRQTDHRQRHGADRGAVAHGMPLGGLMFSHHEILSKLW
jgi:hypothetical protein